MVSLEPFNSPVKVRLLPRPYHIRAAARDQFSFNGRTITHHPRVLSASTMRPTTVQEKQERFFAASHFAVIGVSHDRSRPASKVLGWYRDQNMDVIPVHPREKRLDGLHAIPSISKLPSPSTTALTISTAPYVTLSLLKQAHALSISSIWIQPGAADKHVVDYIQANNLSERVIWGGPCILQEGDHIIQRRWFDETYEGQSF
ncbi:putative coA binding domain containing protein [Lyophyllum shimeji]|uniref:CoA binding domain containing protein n=1 Tax=Lyophyllum shimeji TaxID=47721 RepID=A0A9P3PK85_LYOSH|nr:putative coA binding domain containing protein [Lyophyllum shimeji]